MQGVEYWRAQAPLLDLTNKTTLVNNLILLYQIMVASERLLVEAIEEATGELKEYYQRHLEEERRHEKWLAEDLATAGVNVEEMGLACDTMELAGSQYYLIKHVDPACLLGYMYVLEGFPFPLEAVRELELIHGKDIMRCIRYHSENDPEHGKELRKMLEKYENRHVLATAIYTQKKLNSIFRRLERSC